MGRGVDGGEGQIVSRRKEDYWGSQEQPFWRPGPNPTVDMILKHEDRILLIRRKNDPHQGDWALPGGFHDSHAGVGEPWAPGKETAEEAALRELAEEAGVNGLLPDEIEYIGKFDSFGRDPRDNDEAWSVSQAFMIDMSSQEPKTSAGDDADDARWFQIGELGQISLAFDHDQILSKAGLLGD